MASLFTRPERPYCLSSIQIYHPSVTRHIVGEQVPGVLTYAHRRQLCFQIQLILELAGDEVVHVDVSFAFHGHQKVAIWRNGKVLYSVCSAPIIDQLASCIPLAEIFLLVETTRDKRLSVWSPNNAADWLAEPR